GSASCLRVISAAQHRPAWNCAVSVSVQRVSVSKQTKASGLHTFSFVRSQCCGTTRPAPTGSRGPDGDTVDASERLDWWSTDPGFGSRCRLAHDQVRQLTDRFGQ